MGLLSFIILFSLAYFKPKSKRLALVIFAFMWVVYGLNTISGDSVNFEFVYNQFSKNTVYFSHYEPAFSLVMFACSRIGLSYQSFRMVLACIFMLLTYSTVKKSSEYVPLVLVLYIIFPFLDFVSQLRSGIASAIIMYSLTFHIQGNLKATRKVIIGIIIATLFHYSSVFYVVLLIAMSSNLSPKSFFRSHKLIILVVSILVLSFVINRTMFVYDLLSSITNRTKTLIWFSGSAVEGRPNTTGFITEVLVLLLTIIVSGTALSYVEPYRDLSASSFRLCKLAFNTNIMMCYLIPLFAINSTFMRLIYEVLLLTICAAVSSVGTVKQNKQIGNPGGKILIPFELFIFAWILGLALYVDYSFNRGSSHSVWDLLSDNLVFGILR